MPKPPHSVSPSRIAWELPYVLLLLALGVIAALGLARASAATIAFVAATLVALAAVSWQRERVIAVSAGGRAAHARNALSLAVAALAGECAFELSWCAGQLRIALPYFLFELALVALLLLALYFLSQRRGAGPAAGLLVLIVLGLAQYFVRIHKGTAILPSDLLSFGTAMSVAGGYVYTLDGTALLGVACAAAGFCACSLIRPAAPAAPAAAKPRRRRIAKNLAGTAACACALALCLAGFDYGQILGVKIDDWDTIDSFSVYGLATSFVAAAQDMGIKVPAGYSAAQAQADQEALAQAWQEASDAQARAAAEAQFADEQPSVIVVMNETFADLSFMKELGVGYEGPEYFNSIDDALVRGKLAVSAYAGGTCNSEFEFLCGSSLAYLGTGSYPYALYDLSDVGNLASQLKGLGYETCAIHPNLGTNWNRETVYAQLGFDEFLTIDSFEGAETFHSGVSDKATYETILERLEASDSPQLIFDVTMQNHSSYDQGNIDEDLLRGLEPGYLDEDETAELNEYLACIDASDADLAWLIARLRELERPVVLVFFGDHQPSVGGTVNDALYAGEGEVTHGSRIYETDYLIWANYDVAGTGEMREETASTSNLAALALSAVGAPITSYQEAQLGARVSMPMLNAYSHTDTSGIWHANKDDAATTEAAERAREAYLALARVQYLCFAKRVL